MAKIYTKTGDDGTTGLVSGSRVLKSDSRIELYGEVDELNSFLGLIISSLGQGSLDNRLKSQIELLKSLQINLFNLGSQLACEEENRKKYNLPQINEEVILKLEQEIDLMDSSLGVLRNFILPGGSLTSSFVHIARTCARRVERKLVSFDIHVEPHPQLSIQLINRVSDYLFVLARYINKQVGIEEQIWKK